MKKDLILISILLLFQSGKVFSQSLDNRAFADSLSRMGNTLTTQQNYDSAIAVFKLSIKINSSEGRMFELSRDYNDLGAAFHWKRAYDSALYFYEKSKPGLIQVSDTTILPMVLTNIGMLQKRKGKYELALENLFEALRYYPTPATRASSYNAIGSIYNQTEQFERSIFYYKKALEDYEEIDNPHRLGIIFNNIGNLYNKLNQTDSALYYLNKSLQIKSELNDERGLSSTLNNIGLAHLNQRNYSLSEDYLSQSLSIKEKLKDSLGIANTLNLIGKINLKRNEFLDSKRNLKNAFKILQNHTDLYALRENLWLQAQLFKAFNNRRKEAELLGQYIAINDSLLNVEKARALAEMQSKYDSEKKDQEIAYLERIDQLQKSDLIFQKKLNRIYLFSAFALGVVLLILFGLLRINRNKKKRIEKLSLEMQHRIKNNLQVLSGILRLQNNQAKNEDAISLLKTSESRVNAMAIVHQLLFMSGEQRRIDVKKYIDEMCTSLEASFIDTKQSLSIKSNAHRLMIDVDQIIPIGLIINELVTNAIKHAFQKSDNRIIVIKFSLLESGNYFLEINDNGSGFNQEKFNDTHSFGVRLIKMLSDQLNADLNIFNKNGAVFQFSIPPK